MGISDAAGEEASVSCALCVSLKEYNEEMAYFLNCRSRG